MKKNGWLWVVLFTGVAVLISILATGWNLVLVQNYRSILKLVTNFSLPAETSFPMGHTLIQMALGTCGFVIVLAFTILMFVRLLKEMKLNQFQSEFIATISHELKTPIAAIELCSSLLQAGELSETEKNNLWFSHSAELHRLRSEVEALLEAARWQKKPSKLDQEVLSLENWISTSLRHWQSILGAESKLDRSGDLLDISIQADPKMLSLIMDNLMSNAKKFSRGSPHVFLATQKILLGKQKGKWRISVRDNGWGFHPNDSRKIFQRFFRSKSSAPYAIPGTGLGLYLAATASRSMGLSMQATSLGPGLGACFTIEGKFKR